MPVAGPTAELRQPKKIQHDNHHLISLLSWILGQRVKKGCHKIGA